MIERRDTANKTPAEVELLGEERERERRNEATALQRLTRDLVSGQTIFRGQVDDVDGSDLRTTAQRLVLDRLDQIYPQLDQFTANLRREDVLHLLRTADLGTVPEALRDGGIGLVRVTPTGWEVVTETGPLHTLVAEVSSRASYGQEATGSHLERHFAEPPYGAPVEVVQALCAAGIRAGLLEVIHQGQPIRNAADARLDQVFSALPRFRAAAFRPPAESDVPLDKRVELAEKLEQVGHHPPGHSTDALATAVRDAFLAGREATIRVESALVGAGLNTPDAVSRTKSILDRIASDNDVDVVLTAHDTWADLVAGRSAVVRLDQLIADQLSDLRAAQREARRDPAGLPEELVLEHSELCDLLAAGDLADHAARIVAIGHRLAAARKDAATVAAQRLVATLEELRSQIREQFSELEDAAVAEAVRPLDALVPPEDLSGVDANALEARIDSAKARAATAERQLEELRSAAQLAWVRVGELVTEPITEEAEIEPVLDRIREAVAAELTDGKHVRLQ